VHTLYLFFELLAFLELQSLIITDLDAVLRAGGQACAVHLGTYSSNACLKAWFSEDTPFTLAGLIARSDDDKARNGNRIAYQCAEVTDGPCGRTFEDAFILANSALFGLVGRNTQELEIEARDKAAEWKKSEFALKYAITETEWNAPKYIVDGIRWLAGSNELMTQDPVLAQVVEATTSIEEGASADV